MEVYNSEKTRAPIYRPSVSWFDDVMDAKEYILLYRPVMMWPMQLLQAVEKGSLEYIYFISIYAWGLLVTFKCIHYMYAGKCVWTIVHGKKSPE